MDIPGGDLLDLAMSVIQPQSINYFANTARTRTAGGTFVPTLAPYVSINSGSFQPMPQTRVAMLGLDITKRYATWYVSSSVIGIERSNSGDVVEFNGRRYQVQVIVDWFGQDGWVAATCVDIGPATGVPAPVTP